MLTLVGYRERTLYSDVSFRCLLHTGYRRESHTKYPNLGIVANVYAAFKNSGSYPEVRCFPSHSLRAPLFHTNAAAIEHYYPRSKRTTLSSI